MTFRQIFAVFAFSTLAVGCSSSTVGFYGDGGTDGASKNDGSTSGKSDGGLKFDTGTPKTDSGVPKDTGTVAEDAGDPCEVCQTTYCSSQIDACAAEKACVDTVNCIQMCSDDTCANNCVTMYGSTKFEPFYTCIYDNCLTACSGP